MRGTLASMAVAAWLGVAGVAGGDEPAGLVVHEWGTFTSVVGGSGVALEWRPLADRTDLPSFVYTVRGGPEGLRVEGGYKAASGTAIIDELGAEHMRSGAWIVYTSADSVFQIAAHEQVVPLEELYRGCEIAYAMVAEGLGVGRVIARPLPPQTLAARAAPV